MISMKNYYLSLIFFLTCFFFLGSCQKKEYAFEAPTVEIISTQVLSENECEVDINIDMGVGALIEEAFVEITNLATEEAVPGYQHFTLTKERVQHHNIKIKVAAPRNDYRMKAVLKSQKNEYTSIPSLIRFTEEILPTGITYMELIVNDYDYVDEITKVGNILKGGDLVIVAIYYSHVPPLTTKFEIKLNGEIPLACDVSFMGFSENAEGYAYGTLPDDIPPGIYSVHMYVNGAEHVMAYKIRVLGKISRIIELDNMPYDNSYLSQPSTHFVDGDEVCYMHEEFDPPKMILYNPKTREWDEKNVYVEEKPYAVDFVPGKIINGKEEYLIVHIYSYNPFDNMPHSVERRIVSFDKENNQWKRITAYPGRGTTSLIKFAINNKIYIGGGVRDLYDNGAYFQIENQTDFWEYDMDTGVWTEKQPLPYETKYNGFINSSAATSTKGYAFTRNRDLWQYTPESDSWEMLNPLRSGPYYRHNSKLLSLNDRLYLVGGYSYIPEPKNLRDCWNYDLSTGEWILIDMHEVYISPHDIETFVYNDKVMLGYFSHHYGTIYVEIDIP